MAFAFKKASAKRAKLRASIMGPAGSGKTLGSLLLARGLVGAEGRIALIDTEHLRAEAYANLVDFDVAALDPPFSPERYIEAFESAWELGYDALVVDSLSHAWAGTGGVRQIVDREKEKSNGQSKDWRAWAKGSDMQQRLVDKIVASPSHIVCTIRTKMATALVDGKVVKVGLEAVQREGIEYEYDLVLDVNYDHDATVSKCNTTWSRQVREALAVERRVSIDLGRKVRSWIETAPPEDPLAKKRAWLEARAAELPGERVEKFLGLVRVAKDGAELEALEAKLDKALRVAAAAPLAEAMGVPAGHPLAPDNAAAADPVGPSDGSPGASPEKAAPTAAAVPSTGAPGGGGVAPEVPRPAAGATQPAGAATENHARGTGAGPAPQAAPATPTVAPAASLEGKPVTADEVRAWLGSEGPNQTRLVEDCVRILAEPTALLEQATAAFAQVLARQHGVAWVEDMWRTWGGGVGTGRDGKKAFHPITGRLFSDVWHGGLRNVAHDPASVLGKELARIAEAQERAALVSAAFAGAKDGF